MVYYYIKHNILNINKIYNDYWKIYNNIYHSISNGQNIKITQ